MILLIVVALLVTPNWVFSDEYTPPTDEELMGWWENLTTEERLEELRKLDYIENASLDFPQLEFATIFIGNDLYLRALYPQGTSYYLVGLGPLSYRVSLDDFYFPSVLQEEPPDYMGYVLMGVLSFLGGMLLQSQIQK